LAAEAGSLTVLGREQEVDSQVSEELKKLSVEERGGPTPPVAKLVPTHERGQQAGLPAASGRKRSGRRPVHDSRSDAARSTSDSASQDPTIPASSTRSKRDHKQERQQRILSALLDKPELSDALEPFDNISPGDTWENVRGKVKYEDVVKVGKALMKEAELIAGDFKTLMRSKEVEKLLESSERPTDVKDFERKIIARWGADDKTSRPYKIWTGTVKKMQHCFLSRLERYLNEFSPTEKRQADLIVAMAYLSTFNWCLTSKRGKPFERYALPSDQPEASQQLSATVSDVDAEIDLKAPYR